LRKRCARIGATAILEVHHREGDLAHHVDPAHRFVELDAVEDDDLAVDARDVVEMQIAVAFAHEALLPTTNESVAARGVLALGPGAELLELGLLRCGLQQGREDLEVALRETQDFVGGAERAVGSRDRDRAVELGDPRREHVDVGGPSWPAASNRLASASWGNSRIFTAYSSAGPGPPTIGASMLPVIGTTSR
jgi:hypothetical protein